MTNIITGLPVSDHDHAVNGLEFTDDGNLMIQVGGNTNAGVPGPISSREDLDEGYFSAATLIAYLSTGERNSYDICLHSNGNLYATGTFMICLIVIYLLFIGGIVFFSCIP